MPPNLAAFRDMPIACKMQICDSPHSRLPVRGYSVKDAKEVREFSAVKLKYPFSIFRKCLTDAAACRVLINPRVILYSLTLLEDTQRVDLLVLCPANDVQMIKMSFT